MLQNSKGGVRKMLVLLLLLSTVADAGVSGWFVPPPNHDAPPICDLPVWRYGQEPAINFKKQNKPILIQGVLDSIWKNAFDKWSDREHFLQLFDSIPVADQILINQTLDVSQDGTASATDFMGNTVGSFLRNLDSEQQYKMNKQYTRLQRTIHSMLSSPLPKPLLFQRTEEHESLLQHFVDAKKVPFILENMELKYRVVSIGGPDGGLPPHKHSASWLGVVVGKKRWWFFPPSSLSPEKLRKNRHAYEKNKTIEENDIKYRNTGNDIDNSINDFGDNNNNNNSNDDDEEEDDDDDIDRYSRVVLNSPSTYTSSLSESLRRGGLMMECVQGPGDLIWIPENWIHSTSNIGEVVAVGAQSDHLESHSLDEELAWENEPLNVMCIQELASKQMLEGVDAAMEQKRKRKGNKNNSINSIFTKVLHFIYGRVKVAVEQTARGHFHPRDSNQLIGRMGMFMDNMPDTFENMLRRHAAAAAAGKNAAGMNALRDFKKDTKLGKMYNSVVEKTRKAYSMSNKDWKRKARQERMKRKRKKVKRKKKEKKKMEKKKMEKKKMEKKKMEKKKMEIKKEL